MNGHDVKGLWRVLAFHPLLVLVLLVLASPIRVYAASFYDVNNPITANSGTSTWTKYAT